MRFHNVSMFLLMATVIWSEATHGQVCPSQRITLQRNQQVSAPVGFDQVSFFDVSARRQVGTPGALSGQPPAFTVNDLVLSTAQAHKEPTTHTPDQIQIRWGKSSDPNAECLQPFDAVVPPPPPFQPRPVDVQKCRTKGEQKRMEIRTERKLGNAQDDFSLVVFCRDVTAQQIGRDYGVEGDPIYVGLYDDGTLLNPRIEFTSCSIEPAGPRIFQSESAFPGGVQSAAVDPFELKILAQRACFDASVQIDLKAQRRDGTEVSKSFTLQQARRYHATLQVGPVFTERQAHSFGLRVDEENNKRIFDKGPVNRGPEYMAALVIYALPRQLGSVFGGEAFRGRDILHEKSFADRLGGVLGVGVRDPAKSFAAGLSFELFDYVNVIAVYRWARLPQLTGVEEDDVFLGTADQIPVRDEWKGHFEAGLAIDLRYVTALFRR